MEPISCDYDDDKSIVTLGYKGGCRLVVLVSCLEESMELTSGMKSKLVWLLYNEPSTFAELYLSGELGSYLGWYEEDVRRQEGSLRNFLEKHYDPQTAWQMAREFMMYDS